ncbi:MAG: hypothetical protein QW474_00005 [Candidatus Aenigmatarchaeota archaeon]
MFRRKLEDLESSTKAIKKATEFRGSYEDILIYDADYLAESLVFFLKEHTIQIVSERNITEINKAKTFIYIIFKSYLIYKYKYILNDNLLEQIITAKEQKLNEYITNLTFDLIDRGNLEITSERGRQVTSNNAEEIETDIQETENNDEEESDEIIQEAQEQTEETTSAIQLQDRIDIVSIRNVFDLLLRIYKYIEDPLSNTHYLSTGVSNLIQSDIFKEFSTDQFENIVRNIMGYSEIEKLFNLTYYLNYDHQNTLYSHLFELYVNYLKIQKNMSDDKILSEDTIPYFDNNIHTIYEYTSTSDYFNSYDYETANKYNKIFENKLIVGTKKTKTNNITKKEFFDTFYNVIVKAKPNFSEYKNRCINVISKVLDKEKESLFNILDDDKKSLLSILMFENIVNFAFKKILMPYTRANRDLFIGNLDNKEYVIDENRNKLLLDFSEKLMQLEKALIIYATNEVKNYLETKNKNLISWYQSSKSNKKEQELLNVLQNISSELKLYITELKIKLSAQFNDRLITIISDVLGNDISDIIRSLFDVNGNYQINIKDILSNSITYQNLFKSLFDFVIDDMFNEEYGILTIKTTLTDSYISRFFHIIDVYNKKNINKINNLIYYFFHFERVYIKNEHKALIDTKSGKTINQLYIEYISDTGTYDDTDFIVRTINISEIDSIYYKEEHKNKEAQIQTYISNLKSDIYNLLNKNIVGIKRIYHRNFDNVNEFIMYKNLYNYTEISEKFTPINIDYFIEKKQNGIVNIVVNFKLTERLKSKQTYYYVCIPVSKNFNSYDNIEKDDKNLIMDVVKSGSVINEFNTAIKDKFFSNSIKISKMGMENIKNITLKKIFTDNYLSTLNIYEVDLMSVLRNIYSNEQTKYFINNFSYTNNTYTFSYLVNYELAYDLIKNDYYLGISSEIDTLTIGLTGNNIINSRMLLDFNNRNISFYKSFTTYFTSFYDGSKKMFIELDVSDDNFNLELFINQVTQSFGLIDSNSFINFFNSSQSYDKMLRFYADIDVNNYDSIFYSSLTNENTSDYRFYFNTITNNNNNLIMITSEMILNNMFKSERIYITDTKYPIKLDNVYDTAHKIKNYIDLYLPSSFAERQQKLSSIVKNYIINFPDQNNTKTLYKLSFNLSSLEVVYKEEVNSTRSVHFKVKKQSNFSREQIDIIEYLCFVATIIINNAANIEIKYGEDSKKKYISSLNLISTIIYENNQYIFNINYNERENIVFSINDKTYTLNTNQIGLFVSFADNLFYLADKLKKESYVNANLINRLMRLYVDEKLQNNYLDSILKEIYNFSHIEDNQEYIVYFDYDILKSNYYLLRLNGTREQEYPYLFFYINILTKRDFLHRNTIFKDIYDNIKKNYYILDKNLLSDQILSSEINLISKDNGKTKIIAHRNILTNSLYKMDNSIIKYNQNFNNISDIDKNISYNKYIFKFKFDSLFFESNNNIINSLNIVDNNLKKDIINKFNDLFNNILILNEFTFYFNNVKNIINSIISPQNVVKYIKWSDIKDNFILKSEYEKNYDFYVGCIFRGDYVQKNISNEYKIIQSPISVYFNHINNIFDKETIINAIIRNINIHLYNNYPNLISRPPEEDLALKESLSHFKNNKLIKNPKYSGLPITQLHSDVLDIISEFDDFIINNGFDIKSLLQEFNTFIQSHSENGFHYDLSSNVDYKSQKDMLPLLVRDLDKIDIDLFRNIRLLQAFILRYSFLLVFNDEVLTYIKEKYKLNDNEFLFFLVCLFKISSKTIK